MNMKNKKNKNCSCQGASLDKLIQPNILIILSSKKECHGYAIVQELEKIEVAGIDKSGVYRTLKSMEERGIIKARWDNSEGDPPKKVYSLTDYGVGCLKNWVETLIDYRAKISEIINVGRNIIEK